MIDRLHKDPLVPGAFRVLEGTTAQSWVNPERPDVLAFEYVQQIATILDQTQLTRPVDERIRVIHVGGAGMTLPRWVEWRRPTSAQIVLEPDSDLVAEVRRKIPLPKRCGIKIREIDGRSGINAMREDYADVIIIDAFAEASVPGELATREFFQTTRAVVREGGLVLMNMSDHAPFAWARRTVAGLAASFKQVLICAEPAVFKGRRFGNLVVAASQSSLPVADIVKASASAAFPYRVIAGKEQGRWLGGALPFDDDDAQDSPRPAGSHFWFS